MIKLNVHAAKTHLSRYLARLAKGETIVLCKRNVPIAEIRALPAARTTRRPIGLARDVFRVPRSFFEALPDAELDAFEGVLPLAPARSGATADVARPRRRPTKPRRR